MINEALMGLGGIALGALGKAYASRQDRGSKEDSALARVLERRDEDCRRLQDRLSAAATEVDLRGAQVGDLSARVELIMEQMSEMRSERDREREMYERGMDECEARNAELTQRVFQLEQRVKRITPPGDTPAVGVQKPIMSEVVVHE
jgi:chromosome segregation ATPase